jgi:hypothetical protein
MYGVYNWKEYLWNNARTKEVWPGTGRRQEESAEAATGEERRSCRFAAHRPSKAERMLREEALRVKYSLFIMMQTSAFRTGKSFGTGMLEALTK